MLLLVAAAVLAGLGFGCCWLFVARPLRKRADDATHEAARAQRSLADRDKQLTDERAKRRVAEGVRVARIDTLEKERRIQQQGYAQDRAAWGGLSNGLSQHFRNSGDITIFSLARKAAPNDQTATPTTALATLSEAMKLPL